MRRKRGRKPLPLFFGALRDKTIPGGNRTLYRIMIISASRRTDIPAFYSQWLCNRIRERYVLVPNPFNPHAVSRVSLSPDLVDCIVFWTKNPAPMLGSLDRLGDYRYYFQFTLNGYGSETECGLPSLERRLDTFRRLADRIGCGRVVWRYDPVWTDARYDVAFHAETFDRIATSLRGYTEKCMLGFLDSYHHIRRVIGDASVPGAEDMERLAVSFRTSAARCGIVPETCTSKVDLSRFGIRSGQCIDRELVERLTGYRLSAKRDGRQRSVCNCIESVDMGMYESCPNGCIYCYAVRGGRASALRGRLRHDASSPMLLGRPGPDDTVRERTVRSLRAGRGSLFRET